MKIEQAKINRLLQYLHNQRALSEQLQGESQAKDSIESEIRGIELALMILEIEVK